MTQTEKLYGGALYELAVEEGSGERILREMTVVDSAFGENPDYLYLLSTPALPKAERCDILDRCFRDRVDGNLLNFMKILCENGTIRRFSGCLREYRRRYNEDNGILEAVAVTAVPLSGELAEKLRDRLCEVTGKSVDLTCRVDPSCLGGVRLEMDGARLDGTVSGRLEDIRRRLKETVI